ncbi:MAG: putative selenate ABC transporter substrate-binding protein [Verrucomicrobiae bacterium]|nr:putative selenate ABC transporter substrate-binding protein [Verrucomicrobiae bacterium]
MKKRQFLAAAMALPFAIFTTSCEKKDASGTETDGATAASAEGAAAQPLRFSAIPDMNTTEQTVKFKKLADYLADTLGVKTEFIPAADYDASVSKFVNGEIHLAWFGGLTGVQARAEVDGAQAIAQGTEDPEYFSYFIANVDTGLEPSDDFPAGIKDLKFTFGSQKSTSGRLMPEFFIRKETGSGPDDWFSQPVGYSGAHDKTAKLVEAGTWQAGVLSYTTYDKMVAEGNLDPAICKIIWKTPNYADYNWTAHPDLETIFGEGFITKLQKALIDIDDPELLQTLQRSGMVEAKNSDFEGIADVATALGLLN